jgi:hypothetical protein
VPDHVDGVDPSLVQRRSAVADEGALVIAGLLDQIGDPCRIVLSFAWPDGHQHVTAVGSGNVDKTELVFDTLNAVRQLGDAAGLNIDIISGEELRARLAHHQPRRQRPRGHGRR